MVSELVFSLLQTNNHIQIPDNSNSGKIIWIWRRNAVVIHLFAERESANGRACNI